MGLFLTRRAEERRSSALHDPPDRSAAARGRTGVARAVVGAEAVLESAEIAVGVTVVAQRGAAGRDRLLQHRLDGRRKPVRAGLGLAVRNPFKTA